MKPFMLVLLAASLAANVSLALFALRKSPAPASSSSAETASVTADAKTGSAAKSSASGGATTGSANAAGASGSNHNDASTAPSLVWQPNAPESELRQVVTKLRAAGYPPNVIRAVVSQLLNERFASRQPGANQPYWKQGPSADMIAAQRTLGQERQALYDSLLGADARASASMDAATRYRRYGNLSDDKIDAIARIERDYSEMTSEAMAARRSAGSSNIETIMQTQQVMEREKLADIAALLTPEELAQYELRQSQSARTLMNNLRNVEITEAEYTALYAAQKAFDTANPRRTTMDGAQFAQRQAAQSTLNEQVRGILADDRFYDYLEGSDSNYANLVRTLSAFPSVTKSASYQVYQLQTDLQRTMIAQSSGGNGPPSPERVAEMRATVESYNARLESLIGHDAAEAYRKQGSGRMFAGPRVLTSTTTTTSAPVAK